MSNAPDNPSSEEPIFHREEFPFYWVVNAHARYTQIMEVTLKKVQLDVSRFRVLTITDQYGTASISQIAEYAIAKMPTVTKIVGRLREDGLVSAVSSERDARVTEVTLTLAGKAKVAEAQRLTQKVFNKAFKGMTHAQIAKMNQSLGKVLDNLNEL